VERSPGKSRKKEAENEWGMTGDKKKKKRVEHKKEGDRERRSRGEASKNRHTPGSKRPG